MSDHALHIRRTRCGDKIACSLDAQAGIAREAFFILWHARREGEIRELMDDRLRRRSLDRTRECICIENIDHHRLGAKGPQSIGLVSGPCGADDGMPDHTQ